MKILDLNDYISEKKKINPLTIGDFRKLAERDIVERDSAEKDMDWKDIKNFKLEKIPVKYDNLKDGYILRLEDNDLHLVMSRENVERLYPSGKILVNKSEYFFMMRDAYTSPGFCYVPSNVYSEDLVYHDGNRDVIELYSTVFSCDMLKDTEELKEVCELIKHSDAYIKSRIN